jgi:hypothetical protein
MLLEHSFSLALADALKEFILLYKNFLRTFLIKLV